MSIGEHLHVDGKLVGGKIQARDARCRIGWIVSRTTSKRLEPQTALRWTTGSHSELTEPYGSVQAKMDDGAPWHRRVLQGAETLMTSWHKEEEEASRRRATKRDFRDLEPPRHL